MLTTASAVTPSVQYDEATATPLSIVQSRAHAACES